jgi:8-amino-7-oxononanoate synthase
MRPFLEEVQARLEAIKADGLHRQLSLPEGIDFSSNDYLGLSHHPRLREAVLQAAREGDLFAPASRLLRGNTRRHQALEERLAQFKGTELALLFSSGYQANLALLAALIRSDDTVLSDEHNHASIVDGLRSCGCRVVRYPHLDAAALEAALKDRPARGRIFIVTESLFSMDGDIAPLALYARLAEAHGAELIVDDAHATGIYGSRRSGLTEHHGVETKATAIVSTLGKALGVFGAFVAGPAVVIEYLINKARPFIFTTALPPILLAAVEASLDVIQDEPWRAERAVTLASRLRSTLRGQGLDCLQSEGPIVPVLLRESSTALRAAAAVRERGYDVRAVRPPAVPPRTARIRVSVHADRSEEEVDGLASAIAEAVAMSTTKP